MNGTRCHSFFCYKKKLSNYSGFSLFTYRPFLSTIDERDQSFQELKEETWMTKLERKSKSIISTKRQKRIIITNLKP